MGTLTGAVELLRSVPMFAGLGEEMLAQASAGVRLVELSAAEWLFRAGDEASTAYVLASGRLEVLAGDRLETVLDVLGRGAVIGELALLRHGRRTASIRARRDSRLIALGREQFEALLDEAPGFALGLTRALAERLVRASGPVATPPPRTIAIVPLDDGAPASDAAASLAAALGRYVETVRILEEPSEGPQAQLARAEAAHERAVLLASSSDPADPWTAFCMCEADQIVAVTGGAPGPAWLQHPTGLFECELIVHEASAGDELIDRFKPQAVRVVRGGAELADAMARLGRRALGRSTGVVLSGGGARALAHLGVLDELRRAGIRIDRVGGVSLGAVLGAMQARGDTIEQMNEICTQSFVDQNPTNDFTVPVFSLIRGRKTVRMLSDYFGEVRIEELPTPFFCTSTDLLRREVVVHRTGPLVEALQASLSIPGVFPPTRYRDGRLLVDGGVLDNLPAGVMHQVAEGPVIAVDVTGTARTDGTSADGRRRRVSRALRRAAGGGASQLPPLPETIVRCMTLGSADTVAAAADHADLVIAPEISGMGMLDWRRLPEMRRAGAEAARRALDAHPDIAARLAG